MERLLRETVRIFPLTVQGHVVSCNGNQRDMPQRSAFLLITPVKALLIVAVHARSLHSSTVPVMLLRGFQFIRVYRVFHDFRA